MFKKPEHEEGCLCGTPEGVALIDASIKTGHNAYRGLVAALLEVTPDRIHSEQIICVLAGMAAEHIINLFEHKASDEVITREKDMMLGSIQTAMQAQIDARIKGKANTDVSKN